MLNLIGNEKYHGFVCLRRRRKWKMSIAYRYSIVYVDEYNFFRSAQHRCWLQIALLHKHDKRHFEKRQKNGRMKQEESLSIYCASQNIL